ncbi:MAG: 4-alpha-glucanotransferase [bacterium]|nr:4-alpha-glucanotransferase [bacterium]
MAETTLFPRSCGILLHPTCLPGPDGIGDLGPSAHRFVDWLADHAQSVWQVLPLGPTSFGDSPYQTLSAFGGNPLLVSFERLQAEGLLREQDLADRPVFPGDRVDYGPVITWKFAVLDRAWAHFCAGGDAPAWRAFEQWSAGQAVWLEPLARFLALKDDHGGRQWTEWEPALARREPAALARACERLAKRIDAHRFRQWLVARQWDDLRAHARARGVRLVGDIPIFVAHDSSDVWARPELFQLDAQGGLLAKAGVPPDYFCDDGQLWGNPLYDWEAARADGYRWWIDRVRACLAQVDVVRLDHFRGFEAYWSVRANAATARDGDWVPGPGAALFDALRDGLGGILPLIAEDLGVITPQVDALREAFGLPGMKVLQFAWSGPDNAFLPHEHVPHAVVYTGTHDNDPVLGWWEHLATPAEKALVAEYVGTPVEAPNWTLIRLGLQSCAHTFITTMPDVLGLGREARLNLPGNNHGNWDWRLHPGALDGPEGARLARLAWVYRRAPGQAAPARQDPGSPPAGSFA